jgi:hypothetical protein
VGNDGLARDRIEHFSVDRDRHLLGIELAGTAKTPRTMRS